MWRGKKKKEVCGSGGCLGGINWDRENKSYEQVSVSVCVCEREKESLGQRSIGNNCCFGHAEFERLQDGVRTCSVGHWASRSGTSDHSQGYSCVHLKHIHVEM